MRWVLYGVAAAYLALSAAAAWGHVHGKNLRFRQELFKNSQSEGRNADAYRGEVGMPMASMGSEKYPLTNASHLLRNGVTVRNLGVVHMYGFFHEHRCAVLGAVKQADVIAAEQGTFFDHCEAYAKANGVAVADLDESRKRNRAATWGFMIRAVDALVVVGVVVALCFISVRRIPDRFPPSQRFGWKRALEGLPNMRKAFGSWRREWRRQADARKANPLPKPSFREQAADIPLILRGMVAPGHRPGTWVAGSALVLMLGSHAQFTWGAIDPTGSQFTSPSSPALSRWVDRFSADIEPPSGTERTVANSAMLHDSRSMFENAKRIAQGMPRGSNLLVVTGDRHARDFEPWFLADRDFSAAPAAGASP